MIYDYTVEHGGTPADLNYEGYPKSVCTSINDVVCHGIPCDTDVLHEGDIINVDCSTILDGYFSDSSRMFCIGRAPAPGRRHPRQRGGGSGSRQAVAAAVRHGRGRAKDGRGRRF